MFTGIIEQIGSVASLVRQGSAAKLVIYSRKYFEGTKVGESLAVNGVCLTITHIRRDYVEFDLSSETLKKSTIGELRVSDKVNLEKALLVTARLGGHIVTGHIDGVGEVRETVRSGDAIELYLAVPSDLMNYFVAKGSIAINGVSLTVAGFRQGLLRVSIIPLTLKQTTLGSLTAGDKVNIEADIFSKYIEHHLRREEGVDMLDDPMMRVGFLPMGWIEN
ncbi:MAG: riboflavin synthase [Candidatus Margulisbacteria bacterium]|nr:riboflavin synthase [Candidatus Margulisiibacteriota bacterium]MBU1616897.1 riboflavin synthase [Candidatus Margulisiibacteriota bacterium]